MAMSRGKSENHPLDTTLTARAVLGHQYDSHESACGSSVPLVFGRGVRGSHTGPSSMVKMRWPTDVQLRDKVRKTSGNLRNIPLPLMLLARQPRSQEGRPRT